MDNYIEAALQAWNNAAAFRERRLRYKRYTFGDQWGDTVKDCDGVWLTERRCMQDSNYVPVTGNVIRQLVKAAVGYYRTGRKSAAGDKYESAAPGIAADTRTFEEFLISGCAVHYIKRENRGGDMGPWADMLNPARFFTGPFSDPYGEDIEMVGYLHDMSLQRLLMRFAQGDRGKAARLREIYENPEMTAFSRPSRLLGASCNDSIEFGRSDAGLCRVIELWTFELNDRMRCHDLEMGRFYYMPSGAKASIDRYNLARKKMKRMLVKSKWEMTGEWVCRFFSPDGQLLGSRKASRHPFVFCFYPFIDGEIHSFVEELIERQRTVNRLLSLNDRVLSTAAKGALLFPENQLAKGMSAKEAAEQWASPDGVILYEAIAGLPGPQQVMSSCGDLGIDRLLDREMLMMERASGVNDAMRGDAPGGIASASLYESRRESARAVMSDLFDTFDSFIARRDRLLCSGL